MSGPLCQRHRAAASPSNRQWYKLPARSCCMVGRIRLQHQAAQLHIPVRPAVLAAVHSAIAVAAAAKAIWPGLIVVCAVQQLVVRVQARIILAAAAAKAQRPAQAALCAAGMA